MTRGQEEVSWHKAITATEFDVPEGDNRRYPLAFSFQREAERSPTLIRLDQRSGRLFQRIGTLKGFDDNQSMEYDERYPTKGLAWTVSREAENLERQGHVVNGGSRREVELDWLRNNKIVNKQDLEQGFKAFQECMKGWMFMDKYLWKAVPEPMFHVYRTNDGWKTALVPAPHAHPGRDRRHYHFGLGQYDELISWKGRLSAMTNRPSTRDAFEAYNVYEATRDGYRVDLEFVLEDILERFSKASEMAVTLRKAPMDFSKMPYPLFEMFARTRKLRNDAEVNWSDDIAADIVELIDDVADFVETNPQYAELFAKPKENALQQEKWHARPISVMATLGFLNTP